MEKPAGAGAATGCFKCGLPGHWSRDCPSSSAPISNPNNLSRPSQESSIGNGVEPSKPPLNKASEKPKKAPRTRPKLTPGLLLSDDGLGYVLRHFPRSFKFRGRGHEVSDLGNLIGLYVQWHSRLLPYYSFEQFVHKVEQLGSTNRVRTCIRELRNRVADGGDPSKLHEPPVGLDEKNCEPEEANDLDVPSSEKGELPQETNDTFETIMQEEELADEMHNTLTEEPSQSLLSQKTVSEGLSDHCSSDKSPNQMPDNATSCISEIQITDEQKARMEASRLKALEKAAARARMSQAA